jgi:hypothetical protein
MFSYPNLKAVAVKAVEQYCDECTAAAVKQLQTDGAAAKRGQLTPIRSCVCTHCKASQIVVLIGKYDKPNTPKSKCAVQFVTTE